jgi:hypothetical protein
MTLEAYLAATRRVLSGRCLPAMYKDIFMHDFSS